MAATPADVVGTAPLSFTNKLGGQQFVPLSALEFDGSAVKVRSSWAASFNAAETAALLAVAAARVAAGELTPPPAVPPAPAIAVTASRPGPESNGIVVTVTPDPGAPLTATMAFKAVETDTCTGLDSAATAAMKIGVDAPTGAADAPLAGSGIVVVRQGSAASGTALPADKQSAVLTSGGYDVKDTGGATLFTLLPRPGYAGTGGLSIAVNVDASGTTFTVSATYDSDKETGANSKVTLTTLGALPGRVTFLVKASAPPAGAALPKAGSVQLAGGGPGIAASGLFYTS
jgi:hypothetical protein